MSIYGSGALGDWRAATPSVSTPTTIATAPVWQFGDSIARATQRDLAEQLLADRGQTLAVHNHSGRPTAPAVDALEQWLCGNDPAPQIIMATGSNDIFDPTVMAAQIDRTMALVAGRAQVFWKDVQVCRSAQPAAVQLADQRNTGWVNAQIHEAVGRYDNLHLIPWHASLAVKPSRLTYYLRDGVHPNDTTGVAFHNAVVLNALPRP